MIDAPSSEDFKVSVAEMTLGILSSVQERKNIKDDDLYHGGPNDRVSSLRKQIDDIVRDMDDDDMPLREHRKTTYFPRHIALKALQKLEDKYRNGQRNRGWNSVLITADDIQKGRELLLRSSEAEFHDRIEKIAKLLKVGIRERV